MKYNLYLSQSNYSVHIHPTAVTYWLPYSVACVWSYVKNNPVINENFTLVELGFRREKINLVIDRMKDNPPDILGVSFYVWNTEYGHKLASEVKKEWPDCIIVAGGPMTTLDFTEKYPYIDVIVSGEGEENFEDILIDMASGRPLKKVYDRKRLNNLDIPSPYLEGIFDEHCFDKYPDSFWFATYETNRGCPYACTFCDWGATTHNKIYRIPMERIQKEIEYFEDKKILSVYGSDANWGILGDRDIEIAKMLRELQNKNPYLHSVTLQYAKNSNRRVFELAKIINSASGITVSPQSANPETLEIIKRKNMPVDDLMEMMKLSVEFDIATYSESIIGLPMETLETFKNGLCHILECGQHHRFNVNLLQFLPNSELASWQSRLEYGYRTHQSSAVFMDWTAGANFDLEKNRISDLEYDLYEKQEVVQSTNTMTSEDIAEAHTYYVMLYVFHSRGYSKFLAKYARMMGVSYRKFYDTVWDQLNHSNALREIFNYAHKEILIHIGVIKSNHRPQVLLIRDQVVQKVEKHLLDLWEVLLQVCMITDTHSPELFAFQKALFNPQAERTHRLPFEIEHPHPQELTQSNVTYVIDSEKIRDFRNIFGGQMSKFKKIDI